MVMDFTTVHPGQLSIIASDFDARPMSFVQGGDRLGYEPAVARAVGDLLRLTPVWFDCLPEQFYPTLSTGDYDVVWFSQAITQDRRAWADFTRPYGRFDEAVLVREDSAIHSPADLAGKRLGTLAGSSPLSLAEALQSLPDLEWVALASTDNRLTSLLNALAQGTIDALVGDAPVLMTAEADTPSLRVAFQIPAQQPFGIGVLPGNRELLEALNHALNQLIVNGTLAKLWAQWIPQRPFPF
jgi:ABC-type amino acid transport substrate-binding protein